MYPPRPEVDAPVTSVIEPVVPTLEVPVLRTIKPLTPPLPALALSTRTAPLDVEVLTPALYEFGCDAHAAFKHSLLELLPEASLLETIEDLPKKAEGEMLVSVAPVKKQERMKVRMPAAPSSSTVPLNNNGSRRV